MFTTRNLECRWRCCSQLCRWPHNICPRSDFTENRRAIGQIAVRQNVGLVVIIGVRFSDADVGQARCSQPVIADVASMPGIFIVMLFGFKFICIEILVRSV